MSTEYGSGNDSIEYMTAERLKNLVPLTGEIERDARENLKAMLVREMRLDSHFAMKQVPFYDADPQSFPSVPCMVLNFLGSSDRQVTLGKVNASHRKTVNFQIEYVCGDVNTKNLENELISAAARLSSIIQRNKDINGFCRLGAVTGSSKKSEFILDGKIYKSFQIPISIDVVYRTRAAGPG